MRIPLLSTLTLLLPSTLAIINGIASPSTLPLGIPTSLTILTSNYIQSVLDVSIAFGLSPSPGFPDTLGTVIGTFYLGPLLSNDVDNITVPVTVPTTLAEGEYVLSAYAFSVFGASGSPTLTGWNVSVALGEEGDGGMVRSVEA